MVHNGCPRRSARNGRGHRHSRGAAVFDPLKRRIQGWVDSVFDRQQYDYRKALVEFGRGLSSETDLDALLDSIVERLPHTLLVSRVAMFLTEAGRASCAWRRPTGCRPTPRPRRTGAAGSLDLAFLDFDPATDHSHIFLENAQQALHLPQEQRRPRPCST